ncbi:hypothetical protein [Mangrovibacillus cuniculi]|uniref:Uncharacterized protein n=1 Tax=Mangrovibacillus cuniculi TaxID=2593652 RepID=A0A7S8CD76_9BACI|nr:hypothetical protein [Mangrovibacillus cuniculi]QPC47851.1 hypothetical protein G8O30_13220 [Mangrovibacillus cuniculi]
MKNVVRADMLFISIAALVVGGIFLFASVYLGTALSENWLRERGGFEQSYFTMITNNYIDIFQVLGGIFITLGSILTLYIYYVIKQERS